MPELVRLVGRRGINIASLVVVFCFFCEILRRCAAGGRVMVRDKGTGTLLWGLAAGGMTAVVFGVFGSLLYGALDSGRCAAIGGACLCGGGLAGVLGGRKRKR